MLPRAKIQSVIVFASVFIAVPIVIATMAPEYSVREMTGLSDLVVIGYATSTESRYSVDRKSINTYADFTIVQCYKGTLEGNQIVVEMYGGRIGNISVTVSGEARLQMNERAVLFLKRVHKLLHATIFSAFHKGNIQLLTTVQKAMPLRHVRLPSRNF